MVKLIWTEPAILDLDAIADYIALDNYIAANRLVNSLVNKVKRFKDFPLSGRIPPEFSYAKYRELIIPPCRVLYYFEDDTVYITHIMQSEQQLRKYMLEDNSVHEESGEYGKTSKNLIRIMFQAHSVFGFI